LKKSGERRWVYELGQSVLDAGVKIVALEGIVIDITDRKAREQKIAFMSVHDHLTGLYDRPYIIEAAARMDAAARVPVSVAVCDINSVRMVNFAFGNEEGDRLIADVGKIVASCARPGDLVGRTGGDEFTLLLPGADLKEAGQIVRKIETAVERFNRARGRHPYEISLSIGYDTKKTEDMRIEHAIKAAGESLMHAKLLNQKSSHSALLASIMATLYARNQETEEHGQRLARYARMVGGALGLSARVIDEMQLLCMLHDIGKIGIDDRILMKPAALTPEEREEMKKHSEIGHRIALASPEFSHIADYILHHHEKWDGTGYPTGLSGEEIPLQSRILAVCDAYDAMTEDRVYRRAMSSEDAMAEIARCAGTQFDPIIAELFIKLVQERKEASPCGGF
jgi:diguanylate cyclase (GGDEF)-like protein